MANSRKAYWDRVRRTAATYNLSIADARAFMKRGSFREVEVEAIQSWQQHYKVRYQGGAIQYSKVDKYGNETPTSLPTVKGALSRSFYNTMVRRLEVWTGYTHREVREYLSRYENWKDGISPLFHEG